MPVNARRTRRKPRLFEAAGAVALAGLVLTATVSATTTTAAAATSCPADVTTKLVTSPYAATGVLPISEIGAARTCPLSNNRLIDLTFSTPYLVSNAQSGAPQVPTPRARVILPQGYFDPANSTKHYPVIYLLHGGGIQLGGGAAPSYIDWTSKDVTPTTPDGGTALGAVSALPAANSGVIVVMPAGGGMGLYADWVYASKQGRTSPRYESFHIKQLLPWVDANFRTWGDASGGRAVGGLSAGGLGSVYYTEQYPSKFAATASFSGPLDTQDTGAGPFFRLPVPAVASTGLQLEGSGDLPDVYGGSWVGWPLYRGTDSGSTDGTWSQHNPILPGNLVRLAGKDLTLTVGANDTSKAVTDRARCELFTPDPNLAAAATLESSACVVNEHFAGALSSAGVSLSHYSYTEVPKQVHNWANWNPQFANWLSYLTTRLKPAA